MWRWCLRTVQDVGGIAAAPLYVRARRSLSNDASLIHRLNLTSHSLFDSQSCVRIYARWSSATCRRSAHIGVVPSADFTGRLAVTGRFAQSPRDAATCNGCNLHSELSSDPVVPGGSTAQPNHSILQDISSVSANKESAAEELRALLSLAYPSSTIPSASLLRNLYYSASSRGQQLSSEERSSLIRVLGAVSVSKPQDPCSSVFTHPLVAHLSVNSFRPQWASIRRMVQDKRKKRMNLDASDYYWSMRARITRLQAEGRDRSADEGLLRLARADYSKISKHPYVDVHIQYLQALLTEPSSQTVGEAVDILSFLLSWYHDCHPQLLAFLWQIALMSQPELSMAAKQKVLETVRGRLNKMQSAIVHDSNQPGKPIAIGRCALQGRAPSALNVKNLASSLQDVIFTRHSQMVLPDEILRWATSIANAIFSSARAGSDDLNWRCLELLAITHGGSRGGNRSETTVATGGSCAAAISQWQVVCTLASLTRLLPDGYQSLGESAEGSVLPQLNRILEALWSNWCSNADEDQVYSYPLVTRVICSTFFHFAGRLKNCRLGEECDLFCHTWRLWLAGAGRDANTHSAMSSLALERLSYSLSCASSPETAVSSLIDRVDDPFLLSDVMSRAISTWSHNDVILARSLRAIARRVGIEVTSDSVTDLASALATQGSIQAALEHLAEAHTTPEQHLRVLRRVISVFVREGHRFRSTYFSSAVCDAMVKQFSFIPPPANLRSVLQSVLLFMPRFGQSSNAIRIVDNIVREQPAYFPKSFFETFMRRLVDHRQFRLARRVFDVYIKDETGPDNRLERFLLRRFSRSGASSLAHRVSRRIPEGTRRRHPDLVLAQMVRFRESAPPPVRTLKIPTMLKDVSPKREATLNHSLRLLIQAGRLHAAKKLYGQSSGALSAHSRTALGNHILHASLQHPSRRNGRRMRKGLDTLNELVRTHGFVPDRVTVNILLQALMRWTSVVDGEKLRALFDHMVRSGYPGGTWTAAAPPFGTSGPPPGAMMGIPRVDAKVTFEAHVRPLYKMFVKAFHARGDRAAARVVVGILKAVEAQAVDERERRERARATGRRKAAEERERRGS